MCSRACTRGTSLGKPCTSPPPFPAPAHRALRGSAKRRTRKQWDEEWGRIGCEGNLWWLGSYRANWEAVMGHHVWGWFRAWCFI